MVNNDDYMTIHQSGEYLFSMEQDRIKEQFDKIVLDACKLNNCEVPEVIIVES